MKGRVLASSQADILGIPAAACDINGAGFYRQYGERFFPTATKTVLFRGMEMFVEGRSIPCM